MRLVDDRSAFLWRFGALSADSTQRIARASRDELERWSKRILRAATLDDVFAAS